MKRLAAAAGGGSLALLATAASAAGSIDEAINSTVARVTTPFVDFIFAPLPGTSFPWIVVWLIGAATVFTIYFRFVQVWAFRHAIALVRGDYADPRHTGEVSHFQALSAALSGTIGLGNIAGVAVAVNVGGPGATFWMILAGLLGMAAKFTECTLGVKFRNENPDGSVSGGPMYYLSKGLAEKGFAGTGRIMAVVFALCCILGALGGGNMFQANQVHAQFVTVTGGEASFLNGRGWLTGLVLASVVFAVIVGGIKSIAQAAQRIVPLMAALYCGAGLVILAIEWERIPWAFGEIVRGAFTDAGIAGGMIGALIQGFRRAAFSNEAGVGSAAIAHSAVRTNEPITEGFVSLLEPFVDTVIICTMTALVIVITGVLEIDPATGLYVWNAETGRIATAGDLTGVQLTSVAFAKAFSWFPYVLAVAVTLFAYATMISWSYYGLKAWTYLFGEGRRKELLYNLIFCLFVVIGAAMNLAAVMDFADAAIFAMGIMNIIGLYVLMPLVKEEMESYWARLERGEIRKTRALRPGA